MHTYKRLIDLNARWIGSGGEGISRPNKETDEMEPAPRRYGVGIIMNCPCGCNDELFVPFKNPLDGLPSDYHERHTWERSGDQPDHLTLQPSIRRIGGCNWHGYITDGVAMACDDWSELSRDPSSLHSA